MKTNVQALKELYVKLGGSLTDTYSGIADGAAVGNYVTIADMIQAASQIAGGGGSGLPDITGADNGKVLTADNGAWVAADPYEELSGVAFSYNSESPENPLSTKTPQQIELILNEGKTFEGSYRNENHVSQRLWMLHFNKNGSLYDIAFSNAYVEDGDVVVLNIYWDNDAGEWVIDNAVIDMASLLPSTSVSDAGKILAVNSLGKWAAIENKLHVIGTAYDKDQETVTLDVTPNELLTLLNAGKTVILAPYYYAVEASGSYSAYYGWTPVVFSLIEFYDDSAEIKITEGATERSATISDTDYDSNIVLGLA